LFGEGKEKSENSKSPRGLFGIGKSNPVFTFFASGRGAGNPRLPSPFYSGHWESNPTFTHLHPPTNFVGLLGKIG